MGLVLSLLLVAGALGPDPAQAQTASEILAQAMDRYSERLAGVEDLTVRQEVMGVETTSYLVKEVVDGHPVLRPVDVDLRGAELDPVEEIEELWANPHSLYVEMANRWELEGRGAVEGRDTWRLILSEMEDADWGLAPDHAQEFVPDRMELDLAVDELVPLAIRVSGRVTAEGETRPMTFRMRLSDYREVDGYLHPFLTTVEMEGMVPGLSPEEIEEAREGLAEFEREMERMPEAQREMMEEMMGDQIRMMREMAAGGGIEMEMRVTDLQVNAGPPEPR